MFFPLLTLIFITLKLVGVITWSWFWILSPILLVWLLVFAFYFGFFALFLKYGK